MKQDLKIAMNEVQVGYAHRCFDARISHFSHKDVARQAGPNNIALHLQCFPLDRWRMFVGITINLFFTTSSRGLLKCELKLFYIVVSRKWESPQMRRCFVLCRKQLNVNALSTNAHQNDYLWFWMNSERFSEERWIQE